VFQGIELSILEKIETSNDIKKLSVAEMYKLCSELREYEVDCISKNGGHLASNMGTIELTVALHRVYDTATDRLVFDVGHQSYAHKIITGRREQFKTLRQYGGLSGFPKPYESADDAFIAGHASNSISVALGMARARTLKKEDYSVACVIGDGALTGGLAYEGLSDAADSGEPLVIILNDNNMSISENIGGMARMLRSIRIKPAYISFKKRFRACAKKTPRVYMAAHRFKEWLKSWLLPSNMFSEMGLYYLGPVDGHDIESLIAAITLAKDMERPTILHVITKKGKGCSYAETHPDRYHGVGPFDAATGEIVGGEPGFSEKVGEYLCRYAEGDDRIAVITAAMAGGTGTECFGAKYPARFFDIGIAEGHAVAMAAGMAKQGMIPVFAVYSSFLQRGFDMMIHDVALQNLHVVFCVDRAGLVGSDGETHHGVFDVSYLSTVPGMTILCPANFSELNAMLGYALHEISGPAAVRYPKGGEGRYQGTELAAETVIREGSDLTIVCYGTMINQALDAADALSAHGVSAEIIKLGCIKPNRFELTLASLRKTGRLLISEEVCSTGCVGARILTEAELAGVELCASRLLNLGDGLVTHGTVSELRSSKGIDAKAMEAAAMHLCAPTMEAQ